MRRRSSALLLALLAVAPALATAGEPRLVAAFDDDADDATGPGTYVPPGDTEFREGDFDLRRFAVLVDGDEVIFEVTLGAPFRRPQLEQRTNATPVELWNNIYLQNIDIYVDTDRRPGSGSTACIPGRRVAFPPGRTWEAAVVLTPQPGPARAVTEEALGEVAQRISFPKNLQTRGRTVIARVPASALGDLPQRDWGYSVHVSGARWERNFAVVDRLAGKREHDAYTMPVVGVREAWAFGGAPSGSAYPRVVDVLLPRGADQRRVLGSFDNRTGAFAQVPFVQLEAPPEPALVPAAEPEAEAPRPPLPALSVVDLSGALVSMAGDSSGVEPLTIGRVLGKDGSVVAKVVATQVIDGGVVARVVEGGDRVERGLRVEFGPPAAAPRR